MMKLFFKNKVITLLSFIPFWLSSVPYKVVFIVYRFLSGLGNDVWYRNSLYYQNISLGISDIDCSIYIADKENRNFEYILGLYKKLKVFLPLMGELNIYSESNMELFVINQNPYESERDPILLNIRKTDIREKTKHCKAIFLIKMIKSDVYGLVHYPEVRRRKWNNHFKSCGHELSSMPLSRRSLLKDISRILGFNECENEILSKTINNKEKDTNNLYLCLEDKKIKESFMSLFTIEWIGSSLAANAFYDDLVKFDIENENNLNLLIENLKWELTGLYTQHHQILEKKNLLGHLKNIEKIIEVLQIEELKILNKELCSLIEAHE